jgi:hypothetical protein
MDVWICGLTPADEFRSLQRLNGLKIIYKANEYDENDDTGFGFGKYTGQELEELISPRK